MQRLPIALAALTLAACGGSSDDPDAGPGPADAPATIDGAGTADAPGTPDAGVPDADLGPDALFACGADQLCLNVTPIDATVPPPGRLAAAWITPSGAGDFEIAHDVAWPAEPGTAVDMTAFATPSAAYQFDPGICPGVLFSFATVVLNTDPDGDGAITSAEIQNGVEAGWTYGITQAIIARTSAACPPSLPDFPEGFPAGVHVYTIATPVHRLDGMPVALETCTPETPACANLDFPF